MHHIRQNDLFGKIFLFFFHSLRWWTSKNILIFTNYDFNLFHLKCYLSASSWLLMLLSTRISDPWYNEWATGFITYRSTYAGGLHSTMFSKNLIESSSLNLWPKPKPIAFTLPCNICEYVWPKQLEGNMKKNERFRISFQSNWHLCALTSYRLLLLLIFVDHRFRCACTCSHLDGIVRNSLYDWLIVPRPNYIVGQNLAQHQRYNWWNCVRPHGWSRRNVWCVSMIIPIVPTIAAFKSNWNE